MYVPKGPFQSILEAAALFALAAWLVRAGVCWLKDVWGWIILIAVLIGISMVAYRLWKHYKDTHF
ncbi:MAG: hypothetical protein IJQ02_01560 [Oscillospiraceae bacterium]|nr:hypothetical protein [Oscillospiraceae bacterium]